jgi:hypothetical protein
VLEIMPADSGPANPIAKARGELAWMVWPKNGPIYYSAHDSRGNASIWSISTDGKPARLLVTLDPLIHQSLRSVMAFGNGRIYFSAEDRESDIWVMETR